MLHITNGDSVRLRESGIPGEVLAWTDVLHEGPVPQGLPLEELSAVRGRFIEECHWGDAMAFEQRDRTLRGYVRHDEVVLWFEHDLFDQLLLLQLLDWFATRDVEPARLTLIQAGDYLGPMTPSQLAQLFPSRRPVSSEQLTLAHSAWKAFRSPDPTDIEKLLLNGTAALPYLDAALERHLEQFPSLRNGLSRTERQILENASKGIDDRVQLFLADQSMERRIFMGDTTFFRYIGVLSSARHPLLDENLRVTRVGADVLEGRKDAVRINGINRWLGGVHLHGQEVDWRWNEESHRIERRDQAS